MTGRDRTDPAMPPHPRGGVVPRWPEVDAALLDIATLDLEAGLAPVPTLFAFVGDQPQAMVTLRPVAPGDLLQAFIEVLALFLPLGIDRIAYSLAAGRDDFTADARHLLVVRTEADGHRCTTSTAVVPGRPAGGSWHWGRPSDVTTDAEGGLVEAIAFLLEHRAELASGDEAGPQVAIQFGRVLLLGHELALSPELSRRLAAVTTT